MAERKNAITSPSLTEATPRRAVLTGMVATAAIGLSPLPIAFLASHSRAVFVGGWFLAEDDMPRPPSQRRR